jgi:hypothetical protein
MELGDSTVADSKASPVQRLSLLAVAAVTIYAAVWAEPRVVAFTLQALKHMGSPVNLTMLLQGGC